VSSGTTLNININSITQCLQCFDAVDWVAGKASGL